MANQIDCSSFLILALNGVKYENSVYTNAANTSTGFYNINLNNNPYGNHRFYANDIAHWCVDHGLSFVPKPDFSNIRAGDVVFFTFHYTEQNLISNGGTLTQGQLDFHNNAFMKIDHASLAVSLRDSNHLTVLHGNNTSVGGVGYYDINLISDLTDSGNSNIYKNALILAGRFPFPDPVNSSDIVNAANLIINGNTQTSADGGSGTTKILTVDLSENLVPNNPYTLIINVDIRPIGDAGNDTYPVIYNATGGSNSILPNDSNNQYFRSWAKIARPANHVYNICFVPTSNDNHLTFYMGGPASVPNASRTAVFYSAELYHGFR